jgi:hypothetical protein
MNGRNAFLISLIVVSVLIAFISPISAYSITDGSVSYDAANDETTWTYTVTAASADKWGISHWTVAWCNPSAIHEVWVGYLELVEDEDPGWKYGGPEGQWNGVKGIKIDYEIETDVGTENSADVKIILEGNFDNDPNNVAYAIKYGSQDPLSGDLNGPVAVCAGIPEFSTIAIPVASIVGLLFFFNHRKRRIE